MEFNFKKVSVTKKIIKYSITKEEKIQQKITLLVKNEMCSPVWILKAKFVVGLASPKPRSSQVAQIVSHPIMT